MEFSRPEDWNGEPFPSPGDLLNPGIEPRSPTLQVDALLFEPQGKPKNTGMGSLAFLQWILLTQELNWGLLVAQTVKCLSTMGETWVRSLGWGDALEKEMAIHSSTLAWRIPWTERIGYSPWGRKESDTTERLSFLPFCIAGGFFTS